MSGPGGLTLRDVLATGSLYWMAIYPRARRELAHWHRHAACAPDPALRGHALQKMTAERLNPEAAALFASTAPRRARNRAIELIVAYQLLYDYLDAVNEPPGSRHLDNGLQLNLPLVDALRLGEPMCDPYLRNPQQDDGAYAQTLGWACAGVLATLPGTPRLTEMLRRAAERCRQAQARNHVIPDDGLWALEAWCRAQQASKDLRWWETAAAGISCLGVHALLALAADPVGETVHAEDIDAAYFPGVCAISALLDSLADHHGDQGTANHSFTAHYSSARDAADRLIAITRRTARLVGRLPRRNRHAFILYGILAFYLSAPTLHRSFSGPVASAMIDASSPATRLMRLIMRIRRFLAVREYSAGE